MQKTIKNRSIFIKLILYLLVVALLTTTIVCIVSCGKKLYDDNSIVIEFSKKYAVFTIPKDASIKVQKQNKYYEFENVPEIEKKEFDNLVQYKFDNTDSSNNTFRIEKDGYITKAGYFQKQGNFVITLGGKDDLYQTNKYETLPQGYSGVEDLMLTNIGDNYFKIMDVGETFDLKLFRNNMIINNNISNVEIEPNFELDILDGDSISFDKKNESNFKITAIKQGVTQVKIKYQAIEVLNNNNFFCYNASNINREVIATFAVGENYFVDNQLKINGNKFDSEFDTIYFDGNNSIAELIAIDADKVICNNEEVQKNNNNSYDLKIINGANIVQIIKGNKSQFLTIYGAKITIKSDIADNKIKLKIYGIYNILPKMSGLYNPTQKYISGESPTKGSFLQLIMANGEVLNAEYLSQYFYKNNSQIQFELKEEYLVDGKLVIGAQFYTEWWGSNLGAHRNITDNGISNNLSAKCNRKYLGYFDSFIIDID